MHINWKIKRLFGIIIYRNWEAGKTISVTFIPYKIKETPYWIYMISGAVLIIVIIFLFKKKKD